MDTGTLITIIVVVLFYFRLTALQYGRAKKARAYDEAVSKNTGKKGQKQIPVFDSMQKYGYKVVSWPLVAVSIVFLAIGVALAAITGLPQNIKEFWWIGICVGVIIMGFNIRY